MSSRSNLTRLAERLINARNDREIAEHISQITRWDKISALLTLNNPKLTTILTRYVTRIDFIGAPLVDRYAPIIDTQYGFPTLLTHEQEVNFMSLLEQFRALEEYRVVITLDNLPESDQRKLLRDPRGRYLAINTRSFMVPDWIIAPIRSGEDRRVIRTSENSEYSDRSTVEDRQYNGLIDALRRRNEVWGSDFGLMLPRFYYYQGILFLDGPIFRYWNQSPDYAIHDFLSYHTIVIKQLPRSSEEIQLRYLRDARGQTSTTLVFLQDIESPRGFGALIKFAGTIVGTNSQKEPLRSSSSSTTRIEELHSSGAAQSRRTGKSTELEQQINFPNVRYSNWIPGTDQIIHFTVGHPDDPDERDNLLTQAQFLLDDVIEQRTDSAGAIQRLPNIHVYEIPILSSDLNLARQMFPNVRQFHVYSPEGELEVVQV